MDAKMKILKPERPGGSLIVQIIAVFLLLLFIGCIYIPLYYWNIPFLNHLFNTWWLWVLPSLPAIWFLWLIVDSVIAFHTKHCLLHLIDFQVDEIKENIQITFKLNGFPILLHFVKKQSLHSRNPCAVKLQSGINGSATPAVLWTDFIPFAA